VVEAQETAVHEARNEPTAGAKANRLRRAAKRLDAKGDASAAQALREAADAFWNATQDQRNALAHASLFTASRTTDGQAFLALRSEAGRI
jgi:hypothetical protein